MLNSKRDMVLAGGAVLLLGVAVVVGLRSMGGGGMTEQRLESMMTGLPTESLIERRIFMASQLEEFGDSDAPMVVKTREQLAELDDLLRERGVDPEKLKKQQAPQLDGER